MSREILFRGKRVDNGEWVEGFYFCMVHNDGRHVHHFILPLGADLSLGMPIEKIQVEINPETTCQYIGITDMHENKIFEGDIVEIPAEDSNFVVEWNFDTANYGMYGDGIEVDFDNYWGKEVEVIGNRFENPELLSWI